MAAEEVAYIEKYREFADANDRFIDFVGKLRELCGQVEKWGEHRIVKRQTEPSRSSKGCFQSVLAEVDALLGARNDKEKEMRDAWEKLNDPQGVGLTPPPAKIA